MALSLSQMTADILRNEGGFVNDPNDAGGITNYGISVRFAKSHPAFFDVNGDGEVDEADIKALTPDKAQQAYVEYFFLPAHLSLLPNVLNIQMQVFDTAVNTGVRYTDGEAEAVKIIQHAVGIDADGELGAATVRAVFDKMQMLGAIALNNAIVEARISFYSQVETAHPEDKRFVPGWINRANKYKV
jgi:lysozyme family protein